MPAKFILEHKQANSKMYLEKNKVNIFSTTKWGDLGSVPVSSVQDTETASNIYISKNLMKRMWHVTDNGFEGQTGNSEVAID